MIARIIDDFLPEWERDAASFDGAEAALSGWEFSGGVLEPGPSETLLNAMAAECKSIVIEGADGRLKMVVADDEGQIGPLFTVDNIAENSLSITRETGDNLYTDFFLTFGLNGESSAYATPDDSTHPDIALDALCLAAAERYGTRRTLTLKLAFIRDVITAHHLLAYLVQRHTARPYICSYRTQAFAATLEMGDLVRLRHPRLQGELITMLGQVIKHEVDSFGVALTVRTIRELGAEDEGAGEVEEPEVEEVGLGGVLDGLKLWFVADVLAGGNPHEGGSGGGGAPSTGTIDGFIYEDTDGSGTQNGAETGFAGVVMQIVDSDTVTHTATVTAADGLWSIAGLAVGNATVSVQSSPAGYTATNLNYPLTVTVVADTTVSAEDLGFEPDAPSGTPPPGGVSAGLKLHFVANDLT